MAGHIIYAIVFYPSGNEVDTKKNSITGSEDHFYTIFYPLREYNAFGNIPHMMFNNDGIIKLPNFYSWWSLVVSRIIYCNVNDFVTEWCLRRYHIETTVPGRWPKLSNVETG